MKEAQAQVKEFMLKAEQDCPTKPGLPNWHARHLRLKLIREELWELECALFNDDLTETYDAILDLLVVTIGTAIACGLEIEPGWQEVHRSNMSKFIDGHKRDDGKWIKGPSFVPPKLAELIYQMQHYGK